MNTKMKVAYNYLVYIPMENFENRLYLVSDNAVCVHKIVQILSKLLLYALAYFFPKIVLLL